LLGFKKTNGNGKYIFFGEERMVSSIGDEYIQNPDKFFLLGFKKKMDISLLNYFL
jgi:hypothetical protein